MLGKAQHGRVGARAPAAVAGRLGRLGDEQAHQLRASRRPVRRRAGPGGGPRTPSPAAAARKPRVSASAPWRRRASAPARAARAGASTSQIRPRQKTWPSGPEDRSAARAAAAVVSMRQPSQVRLATPGSPSREMATTMRRAVRKTPRAMRIMPSPRSRRAPRRVTGSAALCRDRQGTLRRGEIGGGLGAQRGDVLVDGDAPQALTRHGARARRPAGGSPSRLAAPPSRSPSSAGVGRAPERRRPRRPAGPPAGR